jgi:cytochrome b561
MTLLNTPSKYGLISRALHWIIVFGIIAQWLLAEAEASSALALHQSIGMSVLALALVRVTWQLLNPTPALPPDTKPYEAVLARAVHVAFYLLLFAIPISGWALASVEDEPLRFFNWFDVPRLVLASEETMEDVHEMLFNILVALAMLHVLGAVKHWVAGRRGAESR